MYTKPKCEKSSTVQTVELQYNHPVAQQFHSYKLNGTFTDQTVSIYAPANWKATGSNGVDTLAVGDVPVGVSRCLASVVFFFLSFVLNDWMDADQRCDSARSLFIILMIR